MAQHGGRQSAVDLAVIERHGNLHHLAHNDLIVNDPGRLGDLTNAENRPGSRRQQWDRGVDPEGANVRYGQRRPRHIGRRDRPAARFLHQVGECSRHASHVKLISILDIRDNETSWRIGGNA